MSRRTFEEVIYSLDENKKDDYGRRWFFIGTKTMFRLTNTGDSSARYGDCEICGKKVPEVYLQTQFSFDEKSHSYLNHGGFFGHADCLARLRGKDEVAKP